LCRDIEALPRALAGQLAAPDPPRGLAGSPGVGPISQQKAAPVTEGTNKIVEVEDDTPLTPSCHGEADAQAQRSGCGSGGAPKDASTPGPSEMPLRVSAAEALLKLGRALPPRQASLEDNVTCADPLPAALWWQQQQPVDQQQEQQLLQQHTADDACHGLPAQPGPSLSPGTRGKPKWRTLADIYAAYDVTTAPPKPAARAEATNGSGGTTPPTFSLSNQ